MSIQINKDSWHNRLRMKYYRWHNCDTLCDYISQVSKAMFFMFMVGLAFAILGLVYLFCMGAYWFVPMFSLEVNPGDVLCLTMLASVIAWGFNSIALLAIAGMAKETRKLPEWAVRNVSMPNVPKPEIEMPGFVRLLAIRLANWHDKVCVRVSIK